MAGQIAVDSTARAAETVEHGVHVLTADVAYQRHAIVNVVYVGPAKAGSADWVLIDTGVAGVGAVGRIRKAAAERYGKHSRPAAIVLTHGHFDHVGALKELADDWQVPVFAHELELPFLNGSASYPPPDPSVGGGMMARLSSFYPRGPIDVQEWLQPLPADGAVPPMPGWRWIGTPGHSPGHISFWREADRTLIVGDAFVTTRQESAYAVATQKPEMHGPPMYYTQDWEAARESVRRLAELEPNLVVTGHGPAMEGPEMRRALSRLAAEFDRIAVPEDGYYVRHPAPAFNPTGGGT